MIYADNAATTKIDERVLSEMIPFLTEQYANASQPYFFASLPKQALKEARETIAQCIGALEEEIFFTCGGTESDNWALKGFSSLYNNKNRVITTQIEHHAVLNTAAALERAGVKADYMPVSREGLALPETMAEFLNGREGKEMPCLVSVMTANNEIGTIMPIGELSRLAHERGAYFHTDGVQALGHIAIDVNELGVDMLSASAHKFNGPKGIGFLYIRKGVEIAPYADGGSQEASLRAGTENVASIVGMAAALKLNCAEIESNSVKLLKMEDIIIGKLTAEGLDFIRNGAGEHIPGNISLSFNNMEGEAILHRLDLMGICVSTGSACDSVNTQVSHVLKAIRTPEGYAKGTVRISLGKNNTPAQAERIADSLIKIVKTPRE